VQRTFRILELALDLAAGCQIFGNTPMLIKNQALAGVVERI
jgi:hypothetical protein